MKAIGLQTLLLSAILLLDGCASTTITSVWNDKDYKNIPIQSVMVIGVMDNARNRNIFENEMSMALAKRGVRATTSSKLLGEQKITKENALQAAIKNQDQAVLVTRLVGTKKEKVYHPPISHGMPLSYYRTWDGYYPHIYQFSYHPGYTATYTSVLLETSIFAVKNHKLIWSAESETFEPNNINKEIKHLSEILIRKMKESRLVK